MNSMSVESVETVDPIAWKLSQLDPRTREEVLRRAVEWGVRHGMDTVRRSGVSGLGQDAAVTAAVQRALAPILPALGTELVKAVEPAAKRAAELVGPAVEEKIKEYGPRLAIVTGIVAGILAVLGMVVLGAYISKR